MALQGGQAPGCPSGVSFADFPQIGLSDQGGATNNGRVLLYATLNLNAPLGVTAASNAGIWAVDSSGTLQLIVRTGDIVGSKVISTLTFLTPSAYAGGQNRNFAQGTGNLAYLATFTDGTAALISVTLQ